MYLIGYDLGSSSIKAALVDAATQKVVASVQWPNSEMSINAPQVGWAEQDPESWWENICLATAKLLKESFVSPKEIKAIGIAYQMHGLVMVDKNQKVLRSSIIWCDSRAVEIGNQAFKDIGSEKCLSHLLNSPGNFTASKLKWVKDHQPEIFNQIDKIMLPGDYIAMKLTGAITTTVSGLSEGMLWDFKKNDVAEFILDYYGFEKRIIPTILPTCSVQGKLSREGAEATGLHLGTLVTYRAGDQPNNALSLNVLQPGEVAATGGTSGVVYGVVDQAVYDPASRVNGFAHVNYEKGNPRIGILLCINGAGIQYKWLKENMALNGMSYAEMNSAAEKVSIGSDGLYILPFGNGAERMLGNQNPGAHVYNLQFNRHTNAHFYRAALEGIAFSFVYGIHILQKMGINASSIRVGNDNLFQSVLFSKTISNTLGSSIQVIETTGAIGAAKASGVAAGIYKSIEEAMENTEVVLNYNPEEANGVYMDAFGRWKAELEREGRS